MFKSAFAYNEEVIFYFDLLGNKYVAQGGSLTWRLNNPGLVRSRSHFARKRASASKGGRAIGACKICWLWRPERNSLRPVTTGRVDDSIGQGVDRKSVV